MAKIIQFPINTGISPNPGLQGSEKSEFQQLLDRLISSNKSEYRSQGFLIGILVANIQNIIVQYLIK